MVGIFALVVFVSVFAAFVGHCFHSLPPFACLRFHGLRSLHSLCRRRPLSLIPLLASSLSSLCWLRWCFALLLIVALFRVFCTLIAVSNRCLAVVVVSSRSLYLHLNLLRLLSSPCSTLDRLDAVTCFGLLLLNPALSLSCASACLSSLSSRTGVVPHGTKLSWRQITGFVSN